MIQDQPCQRPHCGNEAEKVYTDDNQNRLHLCANCYYYVVTEDNTVRDSLSDTEEVAELGDGNNYSITDD